MHVDTSHTETHAANATAKAVAEAVAEAAQKPIVDSQGKQFQPGPWIDARCIFRG